MFSRIQGKQRPWISLGRQVTLDWFSTRTEAMTPKKSSSLILVRKDGMNRGAFDYDLLMFQRHSKGSFSDMYAFPGGVLENEDIQAEEKGECEKYRHCALRETFEETGLFFSSEKVIKSRLSEIMAKQSNLKSNENKTCSKNQQFMDSVHISSQYLDEKASFSTLKGVIPSQMRRDKLHSFLRLITVAQAKARYDCQFFVMEIEREHTLNWHKYLSSRKVQDMIDLDDLTLSQHEAVEYQWINPLECIRKFYDKEILLAPPQFILLNIMTSFLRYAELKDFLSEGANHEMIDQIQKDPFSFPYLIGDYKYHLEKICQNEEDIQLKRELYEKVSSLKIDEHSRNRIYFKDPKNLFNSEYTVDINLNSHSPFIHLKSYDRIQQLIQMHVTK